MYTLYGYPGTGSASVEAALAEIGADYRLVNIAFKHGGLLTEEFRAINPRQQIPALVLPDGSVMSEGAAMLLYLADAFPESGLAPPAGSAARAQHDRWIIFMAINIYEGELRKAYPDRYTTDPAGAEGVAAAADAYVKRHWEIIEAAIAGPCLLGGEPTMADIYLWVLAYWMDAGWLSEHCPKAMAIAEAIAARPKIAPIHAIHFG